MPRISALPPMTSADGDDEAPIKDDSTSSTKKFTLTVLKEWLQSLVAWITPSMQKNDYCFRVYRNGGVVPASNAILTFETKNYDYNNNYSTSTGKYTAPVDGVYFFNACISWQISSSHGTAFGQQFYKNGVLISMGTNLVNMFTGGYTITNPSSTQLKLVAGDEITVRAITNGSTSINVPDSLTYFEGHLITQR